MKLLNIIFVIFTIITIGAAQNQMYFINYDSPIAKDLSNLNLSEIRAIFTGDPWMSFDFASDGWTPSQRAFMKDDKADGEPMGGAAKKMMYIGSIWRPSGESASIW